MMNRTKIIIFTLAAVLRLAATPAFAQSFDADEGTGNVLPISGQPVAAEIESHHGAVHTTRRNGMDSYAMEPRAPSNSAPRIRMPVDSDDPAFTGGGSIGYNELLQQEGD
jgi:hypothetical protein